MRAGARTVVVAWLLMGCTALAAPARAADNAAEAAAASDFVVTQFYGSLLDKPVFPPVGGAFTNALVRQCGVPASEVGPGSFTPPNKAMISYAIDPTTGAIVVTWAMKKLAAWATNRAEQNLKKYTVAYRNKPVYRDLSAAGWSADAVPQSCVIAQRIYCDDEEVRDIQKCPVERRKVGASLAFAMRRHEGALQVLPLAYEFERFVPKHSKGALTFSAGFAVQAIGAQNGAGYHWTSKLNGQERVVLDGECAAHGDRKPVKPCGKAYDVEWSKAVPLPMPPSLPEGSGGSLAALEVTVAEVGRPSRMAKLAAAFFKDTEEDTSAALADALNKQWKLGEFAKDE